MLPMNKHLDVGRRRFLLGRFSETPRPAGPPVAAIDPSCLALRGVTCMSCRDACAAGALQFRLAVGGARPEIATDACTGCGDCIRACPADAIRIPAPEFVA
jgi:ferredoxin-type protein NapF